MGGGGGAKGFMWEEDQVRTVATPVLGVQNCSEGHTTKARGELWKAS